jgi:hypothetical protein
MNRYQLAPIPEAWVSSLQVQRAGDGRDEFFERVVSRLSELERDPTLMAELLYRQMRVLLAWQFSWALWDGRTSDRLTARNPRSTSLQPGFKHLPHPVAPSASPSRPCNRVGRWLVHPPAPPEP